MRLLALAIAILLTACGDNNDQRAAADAAPPLPPDAGAGNADAGGGELSTAVCDPAAGPFSLDIDNPFFPLVPGTTLVLEGNEGSTAVHLEVSVLDETEVVAGVTTRVVEEAESQDGELAEISRNFFVQAPDGTVCYFGEEVDIYENGAIVGHEGAWRAGDGDNKPGIFMPASPQVGMSYFQEDAPGIAQDRAEVSALGETLVTPAGTFTDTVTTDESSAIDPAATGSKAYASGIGLVQDDTLLLVSH